jgi:transposase
MHIASIGIDLGKTTFHLVAWGERNKVLVRKKFSRSQAVRVHSESAFIADWT